MIHTFLSPLMAAGLALIGMVTLAVPHHAARHFGLPVPVEQTHGLAFVRATGGRDIIMGAVLGLLLLRDQQPRDTIAFAFWITALCGALDLVLVAGSGRRGRPLYTHAAGTIMLFVTGWIDKAAL